MRAFSKDFFHFFLAVIIFSSVTAGLTNIFIPKSSEINAVSPMITFQSFYKIQDNSLDALFMGTSQTYNALNPDYMMREYGIESYNLASSQQSTVVTYYWLKEALRSQSPKVVVVDVFGMIPYGYSNDMDIYWNTSEGQLRVPIDWMNISLNKLQAMKEISDKDDRITFLSFAFPMIRYHERWKELSPEDYIPGYLKHLEKYRGYKVVETSMETDPGYEPFVITGDKDHFDIDIITEYMDRVAQLCDDNGIALLLIRPPYLGANEDEYRAISAYADKVGCVYIDFNCADLYAEIEYNLACDNTDKRHANIYGAEKITDYIANVLIQNYGFEKK